MHPAAEPILTSFRFHERYARALCDSIAPDAESVPAGKGVEHHPVWVIGHLAGAAAMTAGHLGVKSACPDGFDECFLRKGPNDRRLPSTDAAYPSLEQVLSEYERQHAVVESALQAAADSVLEQAIEWRLGKYLPRVLDLVGFMCLTHEAMHLGQLADWRRAMGLPGAMAQM